MSIWHDNTEYPDSTKVVCAICLDKEEKVLKYTVFPEGSFLKHIDILKILKWSYEEDLIKSAFKEPLLYMIRDKKTNELYESPVYSDAPTVFTDYRGADLESDILNQEDEDTEVVALYD